MIIIDGHLDLAWNALQWDRNLLESVYTVRAREKGLEGKGRALGTVCLPELQKGRVALCIATVFARCTGQPRPGADFGSPTQAYGIAQGHLSYYRALERQGHVRIIQDAASLNDHMEKWRRFDSTDADDPPPLGIVISMEGADSIDASDQLTEWHDAGLRLIGLTHYGPGRYAGGTGTEIGLSDLGRSLLSEMDRLGVPADLTHMSDEAFWETLDIYSGPVLASHNNCRALVAHQRQFSDEQLKAIIARGGVVGAAFDIWMLSPGWSLADGNDHVRLTHVVDHIDHVCQLAGNCNHAAIGTDLDGGYGREQSPSDLDTIADLQRIANLLRERGYKDADVDAIMHGNWVRFLQSAWS
jgi:membrane dipeptidase